jgi:hypothetical protein
LALCAIVKVQYLANYVMALRLSTGNYLSQLKQLKTNTLNG